MILKFSRWRMCQLTVWESVIMPNDKTDRLYFSRKSKRELLPPSDVASPPLQLNTFGY